MVHRGAAAGIRRLHHCRRRGSEPRPIRLARGRAGTDCWIPDRVQRPALESLPDVRVHQHDYRERGSIDALLRGLELLRLRAGAHSRRFDTHFPGQGCIFPVPVHLAVRNIVMTATVVALGWPWWVNGLAGLVVIAAVLLLVRRRTAAAQAPGKTKGAMVLPSSVRLAKFDAAEAVQEARSS